MENCNYLIVKISEPSNVLMVQNVTLQKEAKKKKQGMKPCCIPFCEKSLEKGKVMKECNETEMKGGLQ